MRHVWVVQIPGADSALADYLLGIADCFRQTDHYPIHQAVNDVCAGFHNLVILSVRAATRVQELCDAIAANPHRLGRATNHFAVLSPYPPTLSDAELAAAGITVKMPVLA